MQHRVNIINNGVVKRLLSTSIIALMVFASFAIIFIETAKAPVISVNNFTFSGEYPNNNSANVALTQSTINVTIQDDEGDTFNWTILLTMSMVLRYVTSLRL